MANTTEYTDLVTSEHADKPKFVNMLSELVQPGVDQQNIVDLISDAFDLDLAIGSQLDVDGQWIGLSRTLRAPILNVYFAFGTAGQGFGQGYWKGPNDPSFGLVTLDDETYRALLKARAAANNCKGTLPEIQRVLQKIVTPFPGVLVFMQDLLNMSIMIGIAGVNPPLLWQYLIFAEYVPIRPAGVGLGGVRMSSVSGTPLFGFGMDSDYVAGFGRGSWGKKVSF